MGKKIIDFFRNKWNIAWMFFAVFISIYISVSIISWHQQWINIFLQVGGVVLSLYAAIVIMAQNGEQMQKATMLQIAHFNEANNKHIEEHRKFTDSQIEVLHTSTQKQITNYSEETSKVIKQLTDNSVLLAEILKRQLEDAIFDFEQRLKLAKRDLNNLKEFKLLRTEKEKADQIANQNRVITHISDWLNYLKEKLRGIKKYLREDE